MHHEQDSQFLQLLDGFPLVKSDLSQFLKHKKKSFKLMDYKTKQNKNKFSPKSRKCIGVGGLKNKRKEKKIF